MIKDYNVNINYRNNLPFPSCGPYLKNVAILTSLDEGAQYKTSTLEKNYIWKPHFGFDCGIKLGLVDQDSFPVIEQNHRPVLDSSDDKLINANHEKERGRGKRGVVDQQSKPWWLRNTTYMENNPFNMGTKIKENDLVQKNREAKKKLIKDEDDVYSSAFIKKSFDQVNKTIEELQKKNPKKKIISTTTILPFLEEDHVLTSKKRAHSLVRFDEDPQTHNNKKLRVDRGIVTNVRTVPANERQNVKSRDVTYVVPPSDSDTTDNNGDYEWFRDYRMEVHQDPPHESFVLCFDEKENVAYFTSVASRIDLKKLSVESSVPMQCQVIRNNDMTSTLDVSSNNS